jgi:hypothetical protein
MDNYNGLINWLLSGDVSIQYQTHRDLLDFSQDKLTELQNRIPNEGWGKEFLNRRDPTTGLWGNGIYTPKWISTHYTLLDLKNLGIDGSYREYAESSIILLTNEFNRKNVPIQKIENDLCVCAMALSICCHAKIQHEKINQIVDYILLRQMNDGGWNCDWQRSDKSSVHTTLSVLEAFSDYKKNGYTYRLDEINKQITDGEKYFLQRRLFKSLSTGEIINPKFLELSYPCRYYYDILRCLDYFREVEHPYDELMDEALDIIIDRRNSDGRWHLQNTHVRKVHFTMERRESRWNTLRALRVIKAFRPEYIQTNM